MQVVDEPCQLAQLLLHCRHLVVTLNVGNLRKVLRRAQLGLRGRLQVHRSHGRRLDCLTYGRSVLLTGELLGEDLSQLLQDHLALLVYLGLRLHLGLHGLREQVFFLHSILF